MIVRKENQEDLIKKQMKVIDELQEKNKLQQYDISKNLSMIHYLKQTLKRRNETIRKAREELAMMKKQNNYENINYVLFILKEMEHEK